MTRLSGQFHTDLPLLDALSACAEAIHDLKWPIESVKGERIIAHAGPSSENPPRIDVVLKGVKDGTNLLILGRDDESNPLDQDTLTAYLDQARDAIEAALEQPAGTEPSASEDTAHSDEIHTSGKTQVKPDTDPENAAKRSAPGWYPDAYDASRLQYWDGKRWTENYRPAEPGRKAPAHNADAEPEPATPRFRSLHAIANIYGFLGWFVAILGTIGVIAAAASASSDSSNSDPGTILLAGLVAVGFYALALFGISAAIRLALAVEENTRRTVSALRALGKNP